MYALWDILRAHLQPSTPQLPAPEMVLVLLMMAAAAVTLQPSWWRVLGLVITVVHETGHALAALVTGGRLRGIRINLNHSGDTRFLSSRFWPFRLWTAWWGYAFPPVVGAAYMWAALEGWQGWMLTITVLITLLVCLQIRNFVALLSIGATAAVVLLSWWYLSDAVVRVPLFAVGAFLWAGGLKSIWELGVLHVRGEGEGSDAQALFRMTLVPSLVWVLAFASFALYLGFLLLRVYLQLR